MDINWHSNISMVPKIDDYFLMCKMKTGSLARLAAELGAFAAGAQPDTIQQLGEAADMMGIGFQILDDVKNLTTGIPGKKRGDDIVEGKKSLPVLLYLHKHPEKREFIFYHFHTAKLEGIGAQEVDELIETLTAAGVFTEANEKGQSLINDARKVFGVHSLLDGFFNIIS